MEDVDCPCMRPGWLFNGLFGRDYLWKFLWSNHGLVLDGFGDFGVVPLFDECLAHARGSLTRHYPLWFVESGTT